MTVTTTGLTRAAGLCAVVAGLIFIGVQIAHPPMQVSSVATTEWAVRSTAKAVMAALALAGITGMYLRQVRQLGKIGFAGYLVFATGFLLMLGTEVIAAVVLPALTRTEPGFVNDVVVAAAGGTPAGDIGQLQTLFNLSGFAYLGGGLLFGIALFRANVLARWAAVLLAIGAVATVALAVLPESFNRPMAIPTGVALIGLGVSLWRSLGNPATIAAESRLEHQAAR